MVILNFCICGQWSCGSYVAQVSKDEVFVYWKIYNINKEVIETEYFFEKEA